MASYDHTQKAPVHLILFSIGIIFGFIAFYFRDTRQIIVGGLSLASLMFFLGFCFQYLNVKDEGESLKLRYGPLPVFSLRIPYNSIKSVEIGKSDWLDGGGIHYIPGRGWIYNLWGHDCVKLQLKTKVVRIGTDDVFGLQSFLETKVQ